jgi:hypothetical protein
MSYSYSQPPVPRTRTWTEAGAVKRRVVGAGSGVDTSRGLQTMSPLELHILSQTPESLGGAQGNHFPFATTTTRLITVPDRFARRDGRTLDSKNVTRRVPELAMADAVLGP